MLDYQKRRVEIIKELLPQFGNNFVLKGGTALTLFYGCPRFSEDIDLDSMTSNMNFIKNLRLKDEWKLNIKKDTDTVFRVMIDYGDNKNGGAYPLKIEVSSRNKNFIGKELTYQSINGVQVYTEDVIANMKAVAFSSRTKARDVFDIGYLLEQKEELFTKTSLMSIYNQIGIKGLDELSAILKIEQKEENMFFDFDSDEYVLEMENNCENKINEKRSLIAEIKDYQKNTSDKRTNIKWDREL